MKANQLQILFKYCFYVYELHHFDSFVTFSEYSLVIKMRLGVLNIIYGNIFYITAQINQYITYVGITRLNNNNIISHTEKYFIVRCSIFALAMNVVSKSFSYAYLRQLHKSAKLKRWGFKVLWHFRADGYVARLNFISEFRKTNFNNFTLKLENVTELEKVCE